MPGREEDSTCQRQHRRHGRSHRRRNLKHRFEIIKTLGQGAYGKVKLGVEKDTGEAYAIKSIRKKNIGSEQDLARLRREIEIMASLSHPHIIRIYEVFENSEKIVLVMEYASGGELYDYCNEKQGLYDEEAREFFRQIVSAVHYLHTNGIVHRDLKLENIVLDTEGNVKIADFGFANIYGSEKLLNTFCGSPLYASPEIVNGLPYSGPEVDCWSLGVLLYAMVYGAMPFDSSDFRRLRNQITAGDYFRPQRRSDACEVIGRLLCPNPATRWSIETLSQAWWLNDGYDSNPVLSISPGKPVDHQSLIQKLSGCSSSESDCDLLRQPGVIKCDSVEPSTPCSLGTDPAVVCVSSKLYSAVEPTEPVAVTAGLSPAQETDIMCASPPIKGILKKPREPSEVCFTQQQDLSNGCMDEDQLAGVPYKRSRSMDLNLIKSVPLRNKHSSQGHTPQRPRSSHVTAAVFDSSRKPKKGILKNCQPANEETGLESLHDSLELSFLAPCDPKVVLPSSTTNFTPRDHAVLDTSPEDCYDLEDIEAVLDTLLQETNSMCALNQQQTGSIIKSPEDPSSDSGIVEDVSVDSTYKHSSYKLDSSIQKDSTGQAFEKSSILEKKLDQSSGVDLDHSDFTEYTQSVNFDLGLRPSRANALVTSTPNNLEPTSGRGKRAASRGKGKMSDPTWRYSTGSQGSTSSGDILDFSYDSIDADGTLSEYFSMPLSPSAVPCGSGLHDCFYNDIDLDMLAISDCKPDMEDENLRTTPPPLPQRPPPDIMGVTPGLPRPPPDIMGVTPGLPRPQIDTQATAPDLPATLPPLTSPFDISYNDDDVLEQILWLENQSSAKFPTDSRKSPEMCWDEVEHIYQQALQIQKEWS